MVPESRYETFISKELIAYTDKNLNAIPDRSKRAITGLSMGGHGAMWNAIRHQDVFGAVGTTSGGMDIRPFPNSDFITETTSLLAGQAADYLHQGADRIYLFNHMDSQTAMRDPEDYREALETVGALETACAAHRRHVITYQDTAAFGLSSRSVLPATLPAEGFSGHYRIFCGPGPEKGRKCTLILGTDTADVPDSTGSGQGLIACRG